MYKIIMTQCHAIWVCLLVWACALLSQTSVAKADTDVQNSTDDVAALELTINMVQEELSQFLTSLTLSVTDTVDYVQSMVSQLPTLLILAITSSCKLTPFNCPSLIDVITQLNQISLFFGQIIEGAQIQVATMIARIITQITEGLTLS